MDWFGALYIILGIPTGIVVGYFLAEENDEGYFVLGAVTVASAIVWPVVWIAFGLCLIGLGVDKINDLF